MYELIYLSGCANLSSFLGNIFLRAGGVATRGIKDLIGSPPPPTAADPDTEVGI